MKITRKQIKENSTSNYGSWSKAQLKCIGISWPPLGNWMGRAIEMDITEEQYKAFCSFKYDPSKNKEKKDKPTNQLNLF